MTAAAAGLLPETADRSSASRKTGGDIGIKSRDGGTDENGSEPTVSDKNTSDDRGATQQGKTRRKRAVTGRRSGFFSHWSLPETRWRICRARPFYPRLEKKGRDHILTERCLLDTALSDCSPGTEGNAISFAERAN